MATEQDPGDPRSFVTRVLPWLVGAGALLVYLLTLNHWVPLYSTPLVARVSGWAWQPAVSQPLTWAVLYPFRWLPDAWTPLALNLFTALCASLVLVLLARSVALLPHDVTHDDPFRLAPGTSILATPTAWIPPVLAAMLCGLQLTFWEHATAISGTMIDLLLLAYIIRCLLEFRIDQDERWLCRCACVYGAGMANDWALTCFLPIFIVALVRITGFGVIYNRPLLRRTVLWWLVGLSLYLWLPVIHSVSGDGSVSFWEALKANLRVQKHALALFRRPAFQVLALALLLPVGVLSIRWKSHTVRVGDDSRLGIVLNKATVRIAQALFFGAALWLGLDPAFSPRHLGLGPPMLTYYYLTAMMAGYCAGYFLLMSAGAAKANGEKPLVPPEASPMRDPQVTERRLGRVAGAAVWVVLVLLPLALLWRNLGQIRITNGPAVREFARQLWADLPAGRSVVLSEDPRQLVLLRMEVAARGAAKEPLPLETHSLRSPQYQRFMAKQFPSRWPIAVPTNEVVGPAGMVRIVSAFAASGDVVYAHPSSGLFFERFVDRPNGLVHRLVRRQAARGVAEKLEPAVVTANDQLWQQRWDGTLERLAEQAADTPGSGPRWAQPLLRALRIRGEGNATLSDMGALYSKSLNYWGVQMQRLGRWLEAGVWFDCSLALNPANLAARINRAYNQRWQRGEKAPLDTEAVERALRELFESYRYWGEILDADGPVDEPAFLLQVGQVYLTAGDYQQAGEAFTRCGELAPQWAEPKLWQALSFISQRDFAGALALANSVESALPPEDFTGPAELLVCRIAALRGLGRTNDAAACLEKFLSQYRERKEALAAAADMLEKNRQLRAELPLLDAMLSRDTSDLELLARKGWCELQLGRFQAAEATLTRVLVRDNSNAEARLHRAIARLMAGKLKPAREDFQELVKIEAYAQNARFGLGAVARRDRDTNAAIEYYQAYLSNSIPGSRQYRAAADRIKGLEGK